MTTSIAVFPGTFDPITYGHLDIIQRAASLFDRVLVAVAVGQHKTPLLPLEQRLIVVKSAIESHPNVHVHPLEGLLADFLRKHQAHYVIRGLRKTGDLDREIQLHDTQKQLYPTLESVFLLSSPNYRFISSTFVREIARLGGDVTPFVPVAVKQVIQDVLAGEV